MAVRSIRLKGGRTGIEGVVVGDLVGDTAEGAMVRYVDDERGILESINKWMELQG